MEPPPFIKEGGGGVVTESLELVIESLRGVRNYFARKGDKPVKGG